VSEPLVLLPDAFLNYRCNLKGCCCGGWGVTWMPADLARLARLMPADELRDLVQDHLDLGVGDDGEEVLWARLRASARGGRCPMLVGEGTCGLQQRFGVGGLPGICVDFPVVPYAVGQQVELSFRLACPAVLDCLLADTAPLHWAALTQPDEMFQARLARVGVEPRAALGGDAVRISQVLKLRERIQHHLVNEDRPVLEVMAEIEWALAGVRRPEHVGALRIEPVPDPLPYVRYLAHCLRTHSPVYLQDNLDRFRRFVFEVEVQPLLDGMPESLEAWPEALPRWVDPVEEQLRPYLRRYLWARFGSCFVHVQGELTYSLGEVGHELAEALRYLAAFCHTLQRPADLALLKVAMGAAAHLYHSHIFPVHAQAWFDPQVFADDGPPPRQVPPDVCPTRSVLMPVRPAAEATSDQTRLSVEELRKLTVR